MSTDQIKIMNTFQGDPIDRLLTELLKPRFTIRNTEVKHRNITHWGHAGLMIGEFEEGKWRRLNYLEILWLRIVAHLRSFEISLEMIRAVRTAICKEEIPLGSYLEDLGYSEPVNREKYATRISTLTSMVMLTILHRSQFVILLTHDGAVKTINLDKADQSMGFFFRNDLLSKTFLCVSLTEVMLDSFRKIDAEVLSQLSVLTTPEAEVITLLHADKLQSVTIAIGEGRVYDLFKSAGTGDRVPVLLDRIWRNGYERITWASKDGRVTYFDPPARFKLNSGLPIGDSNIL